MRILTGSPCTHSSHLTCSHSSVAPTALGAAAFASSRARCRIAKWLSSICNAPNAPSTPKAHALYFLRRPPTKPALTHAATQLQQRHHSRCSLRHSSIQAISRTTKLLLSVSYAASSLAAPKQMHRRFCAVCVSIQHRSRCNSAPAAPAPALCSVTQHLPASDRDTTAQISCFVPHTLQAPQLPPKQMRCIFGRNVQLSVTRYGIAHDATQRPQRQHPRCSLRDSTCQHLGMITQRKATD